MSVGNGQIKDLMDVEVDVHTSVNVDVGSRVVLVKDVMRSRHKKGPENVYVVVSVDLDDVVDVDIHASVNVDVGARVVSVADVMCR